MVPNPLRLASTNTTRRPRIGVAQLTKMAFDGRDFAPLWAKLANEVQQDPANAPALLDLSFIAQLSGDPQTGAQLQSRALLNDAVYRSGCATESPKLRLLAFAAPLDIGGNTPVEFLLEGSGIELLTLYVAPGLPLPDPLPAHDVAIVTIPDSIESKPMLDAVAALQQQWPRPILNLPEKIKGQERDQLYLKLRDVPGIAIPQTARVSRIELSDMALSPIILHDVLEDGEFPLIARPLGSHAGKGLERIDTPEAIDAYLAERPETDFFVSRFVDYSGADGQFRKYRVVFVDQEPFACHMAVCGEWKVWYLNAGMTESAAKRAEEERFMTRFDEDFGRRHSGALAEIAERVGLDYFAIDCAETKDGKLLVFEADNASIVHNMDPPLLFPYKAPQMRKIFDAFTAMLYKYAGIEEACAA